MYVRIPNGPSVYNHSETLSVDPVQLLLYMSPLSLNIALLCKSMLVQFEEVFALSLCMATILLTLVL